ncbi:hypothetical protein POJ06DRAFT_264461 [Lipomyces tetrasporus]|uniref:Uncharacterized protein n=1 Tax=Lipomyces tetrasporus TaxID=54092 RepID=A0AAD7QY72_9ASCO|nr:uncharacterized protein POJ06DRAFT_264461 [Lipomyces tetrasporus]KAJ8103632.1 hypothetical protein POJ06DRAFT_264461 [Lipomyces tetrasporus]
MGERYPDNSVTSAESGKALACSAATFDDAHTAGHEAAVMLQDRLRGQPPDSEYIQQEWAEIVANNEYELQLIPQGNYFESWIASQEAEA